MKIVIKFYYRVSWHFLYRQNMPSNRSCTKALILKLQKCVFKTFCKTNKSPTQIKGMKKITHNSKTFRTHWKNIKISVCRYYIREKIVLMINFWAMVTA